MLRTLLFGTIISLVVVLPMYMSGAVGLEGMWRSTVFDIGLRKDSYDWSILYQAIAVMVVWLALLCSLAWFARTGSAWLVSGALAENTGRAEKRDEGALTVELTLLLLVQVILS
jgi:hypothetical protein